MKDINIQSDFDIRFDPDDSRAIYIGLNYNAKALTTQTDWVIYKFTYDGATSNVTRIQKAITSWDGRTTAGLWA
jgi:hypothetical protein